jgi:hypothetical protein
VRNASVNRSHIFGDPSYRPAEFKTRETDGAGFAILKRAK